MQTHSFLIAPTPSKRSREFTVLVLLLCAGYMFAALGLAFIALHTGDDNQRDAAFALSALLIFFAVLSWTSYKARIPEILFFCIYSAFFLTIRPYAYFLSWDNVFFPIQNIQFEDIELSTKKYLLFLTIFAALFYFVNSIKILKFNKSKNKINKYCDIRLMKTVSAVAFLMFVLSSILTIFVYTQPEFSHLVLSIGVDRELSIWIELGLALINPDEYMVLAIVILLASIAVHNRIDPLAFVLAAASIVVFVAVMSSTGSRGSGVRLVFVVAAILTIFLVAEMPARRAKCLAIAAPTLAAFALIVSILFLPYANQSRDALALTGTPHEQSQLTDPDIRSNLERMLHSVVFYDYIVVGLARSPTEECLNEYMNMDYYSKNVANYVLIGQPFPDATIPTTSLYRVCLGEKSIEEADRYHSELWTTPGLLRLHFPDNFYTAALALATFLAMVAVLMRVLPFWIYLLVAPVWLSFIPTLMSYTFSIDHLATLVIVQGIRLIVPTLLLTTIFVYWRRGDQ